MDQESELKSQQTNNDELLKNQLDNLEEIVTIMSTMNALSNYQEEKAWTKFDGDLMNAKIQRAQVDSQLNGTMEIVAEIKKTLENSQVLCKDLNVDDPVSTSFSNKMSAMLSECKTEDSILQTSEGEIEQLEEEISQLKAQEEKYKQDTDEMKMKYFQPDPEGDAEDFKLFSAVMAEERAISSIKLQAELADDRIQWAKKRAESLKKELAMLNEHGKEKEAKDGN